MRRLLVIPLILGLLNRGQSAEYEDSSRKLRFDVPDGYTAVERPPAGSFAAWTRPISDTSPVGTVIVVNELPIMVPEGPMPASAVPPNATLSMVDWQGKQVSFLRISERTGDISYITLAAILPAKPKALRFAFGGPESHESAVLEEMTRVLRSVSVPLEYAPSIRSEGYRKVAMGVATLVLIGFVVFFYRRAAMRK